MKKNFKAKHQIEHAKRRALERYGLNLNRKSYYEIVRLIQKGKALPINSVSNRSKTFYLVYNGKALKVAYDNKRHTITTFLPLDGVSKGRPTYSKV